MAEFDFKGLAEAIKEVAKLEDGKKLARQAMRKASKLIGDAVKSNAPVDSGQMKKAIKVKAIKRSTKGFGIKVEIGQGDFKGDTFYGAFQEYGWKTGKRGSENRKQIKGKGFMRKAFDETKDEALQKCLDLMKQSVEERRTSAE